MSIHPAQLVAFEGVDGCGKSTVLRLVAELLRQHGLDVVTTREPGGSPGAEQLRELLVAGDTGRWSPMTELLLHAAARAEHVEAVIRPALAAGKWVLCDRFVGSTLAYQGYGMGLGRELVMQIHALTAGLLPDVTFVLQVPPEVAAARLGGRDGGEDRYERMSTEFLARVRAGYDALLTDPELAAVAVDATCEAAEVAEAIVDRLL
jgi:dTMP kinase